MRANQVLQNLRAEFSVTKTELAERHQNITENVKINKLQ